MKEENDIPELLTKAKESLKAAEMLFDGGFYDFSAGRSYYAMFYATEVVLLSKNLSFSKHSAVIAAFGKEFIKTKIFPKKMRDSLISAFELRQMGDYGSPGSVSKEKALTLIQQAKEFIELAEEYSKNDIRK
ncbi:HEPN domain protein [uncultured archaeon]|nr:HEPN domain protein [uncultured archaeon]